MPILRDGMLGVYLRWALDEGDDFVVWAGHVPHVVVVRPDSARLVLGGSSAFLCNVEPTANLFGDGFLRLEGDTWRERRQRFSPTFRRDALEGAVTVIQEETDRLVELWRGRREPFKPTRDLSFTMLSILGRVLFGFAFTEARHGGKALHRSLITLSTDAVLRHFLPRPIAWAANHRAVDRARRFLDAVCGEILDTGADTAFMSALRGGVSSNAMDRRTAIDELRTFLVAGHETSATALAWTIAEAAAHPELVAPLRAEAASSSRARTPDDVAALEGTARLVKEVMRLHPPVPISISQTVRDTSLGRLDLPRGTRVDVCSYLLHRLPSIWPDPERVDPERFLTTPAPGTWLPFLMGPHTCLGMRLAMMDLPLVAARLLHAFELTLPEGPPQPNLRLSLHPKGLLIRAVPRSP
ncbi:MAG TPA: cytochrome P450 [Polyangiaceae bacterium]|nr:cytochrome P450 [Polyangiaceae bacterium]